MHVHSPAMFPDLLPIEATAATAPTGLRATTPALFSPTVRAERRFWALFTAHIRNPNTRLAYLAAVRRFAEWCERRGLALDQVEPTYRAANDALQWSQRKVRRDIADLLDTRRFELDAALGGEPRQLSDAVIGNDMIAGAVGVVRAFVRNEAVIARCDIRCGGLCEHLLHLAHLRTYGVEERACFVEHARCRARPTKAPLRPTS